MFVEQKKKPNYTKEQFIPFVKEFFNEQKEFKEMSKDVIDKSYTITDINRLIIYLKVVV